MQNSTARVAVCRDSSTINHSHDSHLISKWEKYIGAKTVSIKNVKQINTSLKCDKHNIEMYQYISNALKHN